MYHVLDKLIEKIKHLWNVSVLLHMYYRLNDNMKTRVSFCRPVYNGTHC